MYILILITAKNKAEARKISQALVSKKLVACVNIIDKVESFFWWNKKVDHACETLLILKTEKTCFHRIVKVVQHLHSYTLPEIIAIPLMLGEKNYLKWVRESVGLKKAGRRK